MNGLPPDDQYAPPPTTAEWLIPVVAIVLSIVLPVVAVWMLAALWA